MLNEIRKSRLQYHKRKLNLFKRSSSSTLVADNRRLASHNSPKWSLLRNAVLLAMGLLIFCISLTVSYPAARLYVHNAKVTDLLRFDGRPSKHRSAQPFLLPSHHSSSSSLFATLPGINAQTATNFSFASTVVEHQLKLRSNFIFACHVVGYQLKKLRPSLSLLLPHPKRCKTNDASSFPGL